MLLRLRTTQVFKTGQAVPPIVESLVTVHIGVGMVGSVMPREETLSMRIFMLHCSLLGIETAHQVILDKEFT